MPTTTTSLLVSFRSATSWAMRVSARCIAGPFRMTVESGMVEKRKAEN
jgi:hypothetical protein